MNKWFICIFAITLFVIINNTLAVSFTASAIPTSLEAGLSSQLVNFSVTNTGAINITHVNITLPPGFVFAGSPSTTTSRFAYTDPASWVNTTSIGIVGAGATEYFAFRVDTPPVIGNHNFNISTLDANGVFNSSNVSLAIFDVTAPKYSNIVTSPSTNSSYIPRQEYWFNITWTDNSAISNVLLEHNFTGAASLHNDSMSSSGNVYYMKFTDLPAGTYMWRVYANDTNNTFNSTDQLTYIVRKGVNTLNVFLNGSLNSNITVINGTVVNITANASCTQADCSISIARDGVIIFSSDPNPTQRSDTLTSIGLHNYTISVTGNANFSSNSVTYFVATVPRYSTSTSVPSTYSTTVGTISITFATDPKLYNVLIQGDWSGTTTIYTMSNTSTTNYYYNITFPAGTYTWKIYGNYSNHMFNLTGLNSFTINRAIVPVTLSITPQWILDSPIQTNVSCAVSLPEFTAKLYRNGTLVSNPDIQTFAAGSIYEYVCNSTTNQNYTSDTAKNTLIIKPGPTSGISFVQVPSLIEIVQNSTASSEVKVKNTGTTVQDITLELIGIDKNWYSVNQLKNISGGATGTFTITFNIGNVDVKDYSAKFNVSSGNVTISQDFTLRVLPSNETKEKINNTLALYKLDTSKLENKLGELKSKINDTKSVEQKLSELKAVIKQAEDHINVDNYFQAYQTFETIKALINEVENRLKALETTETEVEIPSKVWLIVTGVLILFIIGILVYLFWPVKEGYKPEVGYTYVSKEKRGLFDLVKNFVSKFKRKKTKILISES